MSIYRTTDGPPAAERRPLEEPVDSGFSAPSVDRALEILERLGDYPGGLTLSGLSAALGFPKNAVFRIASTLRARGYLARDERTLRYFLTEKLIRISQPRIQKKGLIELSMDTMRELRDASRETVQIGRRFGAEGVVLEQVEGLHPLRISVDAGLRFPLYNNAPGKLLLAFMPEPEREAMIRELRLARSTARTITDPRALARECRRIRQAGYSVDFAEADEGIHCVAAPIFGPQGDAVATVWISAPSRRLPQASFPATGRQVRQAADRISQSFKIE
jgi:DNA-binding IclR family transcriptional regulator